MPPVNGYRYHTSTSVFLNEVIKLAISATMALYDISTKLPQNTPATTLFSTLGTGLFADESWKLAIPAALYTLQNTLQYVAVSNLDPSTFQVTYQLKILTTAIFSVLMLGRTLSSRKWASLLLLIIGVVFVQLPQHSTELTGVNGKEHESRFWRRSLEGFSGFAAHAANSMAAKRSATYQGMESDSALQHPQMNRSVGLIAVLISCALSGLAGVTFEKVLKESSSKNMSLWIRNCQLSFWSLFPALFLGVIWVDGENIAKTGFFAGYNWVVWTAISFQAAGGIIVALVINFADNIAKNFATSISIIISSLASAYFFDFKVTPSVSISIGFCYWHSLTSGKYLLGTLIVMAATYLYSQPDLASRTSPTKMPDFEKTTVDYYDSPRPKLMMASPSRTEGSSVSGPGTPTMDRKHFPKRDA